ncbi:splicing factor 3B subunit 5-like [Acropora millepora]|uniref:splicing factor 3B subunit 5-like n=2 Tax=Acropora TaxID=6127 RepID=UPI001CF44C6B|nr:splicing factor 3B subunit 5-like [Acropora millepora]
MKPGITAEINIYWNSTWCKPIHCVPDQTTPFDHVCICKNSESMTDRYNIHSQLEHLQSKYVGTGHSDTTKFEWLVNQHRDSAASYIGHYNLLDYFALVENESRARTKFNLLEKMLQPCGTPPHRPEQD